jgi:hypothetical protein
LRLRNGTTLKSRDFLCRTERDGPTAFRLSYEVDGGTVVVRAVGAANGVDLSARIDGLRDDVLEVSLPPDLSLDPAHLKRVLFPSYLGVALKPSFFRAKTEPTAWQPGAIVGPNGLRRVAGLNCSNGSDAATPLIVTPAARQALGADLAQRWEQHPSVVNRPADRKPEVALLTSGDNVFLGGHKIGDGWLFRFAGLVRESDGPLVTETTERLLAALARDPHAGHGRHRTVVLLAMRHGPERGAWCDIPIADWRKHLHDSTSLPDAGVDVQIVETVQQLKEALNAPSTFAIVNPYGEWFPVAGADPDASLGAIHDYLGRGGIWVATGGYPFYGALQPAVYGSLEEQYPSRGFSDFSRIESDGGAVSYYGVQDAHDTKNLFVPAHWRASGDAQGGHLQRSWQTFVGHGAAWESPKMRLRVGQDAATAIRAYAKENGLDRPLTAKMPAALLALWKRCIHIKSNFGTAADDLAMVDRLPSPAIIHIAHYLQGHFDKQLPDHLPPNPEYGTAEQFRQVIDQIHRKGDLFMPYTNHTWWCDEPKGPTFEREGDAPLLRTLEGKPNHEQYGPNGGWSISPYHPAVIAAADRIEAQFTSNYPADILFQDQNGARPMMYDTNPASPAPYAYTQGLIDLAQRASTKLPVSTEDGFDHLVNIESQFCGLVQNLGAITEHPDMRLSQHLADEDWEFFPIAQLIAHDKAFFIHHDLETGENDSAQVAWALALGYQLSTESHDLKDARKLEWIALLDRIQKALGPHYMGVALDSFRYLKGSGEHGVMEAVYGDLRVVSNLTDRPYIDGPATVAPRGFYAHAAGLEVGFLTAYHGQSRDGASPFFKD